MGPAQQDRGPAGRRGRRLSLRTGRPAPAPRLGRIATAPRLNPRGSGIKKAANENRAMGSVPRERTVVVGEDQTPEERTPTRLWGGRFGSSPAEALARLSVSVQFDWRLAPYDLLASRAHTRVLHRAGLLDDGEASRLLAALDDLDEACGEGRFRPTAEDPAERKAQDPAVLRPLRALGS